MMALLSPRLWLALGLALLLAASHGFAYKSGRAAVRSAWDADIAARSLQALAASESARAKEQELQTKVQKVSADYVKQKKANAVLAASLDDSLQQLQAAIDSPAGSGTSRPAGANGVGGPERELLGHCAKALSDLAKEADRLEGKVVGLQGYVKQACSP